MRSFFKKKVAYPSRTDHTLPIKNLTFYFFNNEIVNKTDATACK